MPSVSLNGESVRKRQQEEVIESRQFLTFLVGTESFAMPIASIREIIEFGGLTEVPLMPDFLRGVINLRGAIVPIIDLADRFGHGLSPLGARTCIVIVEILDEDETHLMGALVDAVSAVVEIEADALRQAPAFGSRVRSEFIEDMARLDERFITLLRMEQVLSVEQIAAMAGLRNESLSPSADVR